LTLLHTDLNQQSQQHDQDRESRIVQLGSW
jgi:hypothetical protein